MPRMIVPPGLVYASVCTELDDAATTAWLNANYPTGISSRWRVSDDDTFASGQPNPSPCEEDASLRHVLFDC